MKLHLFTALPQECGHVAFANMKSKDESTKLWAVFATTATALTSVDLGLRNRTTPLATNRYRHAGGERHVGEMQLREPRRPVATVMLRPCVRTF